MSYNITAWKRVRNLSLVFPLDFNFPAWVKSLPDRDKEGYENVGKRWMLEDEPPTIQADLAQQTWKLELFNQELLGKIEGDKLITTEIDWEDEGSGRMYSGILIPLFEQFKGSIDALVVWEGGDSLIHLTIADGVVSEIDMDKD